jgi:hypothetical protein
MTAPQAAPPEFIRRLALNFVSLCWNDETQRKYQAASGFVVSVRGAWWLITAGHILGGIQRALESRYRQPVPFVFERATIFVLGEDDLDVGVIYLPPYYADQLAANKVRPMDEEIFSAPWPGAFDWYALLGFPSALQERLGEATVSRACVYLPVTRTTSPPPELVKPLERFYGVVELDDSDPQLTTLDGMSGGPLIAFTQKSDSELRMWIVAVQSGWHRPTRTIAACFLEPLLRFMATKADEGIAAALWERSG